MRKSDTPSNLPRNSNGRKQRSPMSLLRAKASNAPLVTKLMPLEVELTIVLGEKRPNGRMAQTGTQRTRGTLLTFQLDHDFKPLRVAMHMTGKIMVLTEYRTGYRLCDVDYAIGFRERGITPDDLTAARDTFRVYLKRHGEAAIRAALGKLDTVNP